MKSMAAMARPPCATAGQAIEPPVRRACAVEAAEVKGVLRCMTSSP
jgi:hypothetical protein